MAPINHAALFGERIASLMLKDSATLGINPEDLTIKPLEEPRTPLQVLTTAVKCKRLRAERKRPASLPPPRATTNNWVERASKHVELVKQSIWWGDTLPINTPTNNESTPQKPKHRPFNLAKLPPEIRNQIYEIIFNSYVSGYSVKKPKFLIALEQSRLYKEAFLVFCGHHYFSLKIMPTDEVQEVTEANLASRMPKLKNLGKKKLALVRNLILVIS
jgi:hypothetical protein